MYHHFQLFGRAVEQPMRLDQLQTFVHHTGGIHRNFLPHRPVRMFHRLRGRDTVESRQIGFQKRAARCGQNNRLDSVRVQTACVIFRQNLVNRIVFAVYRQHLCTGFARGFHKQRAGNHQGFFICQINGFARCCCCQSRRQSGGADDRSHHTGYFRCGRHINQSLAAVQYFGINAGQAQIPLQFSGTCFIRHYRITGSEGAALLGQFCCLPMAGQRKHFESFRMTRHHIQRTHAYAAGGSQYC